ncbi:MAG: hypothetical protein JJU33_01820 [Phycisphaerales bacterium]|nr:hypothetical protein [Phycisphaerales bacterium]
MPSTPALTMSPFDPFEAGAAERLAAAGESGGDPFPVRRVAWNDPPRFRPFAARWRRSGFGWRTRIVPGYLAIFASIGLFLTLFIPIAVSIAVELDPRRKDDIPFLIFSLAAGLGSGLFFLLIYSLKFRSDHITVVRTSSSGGVRLSRHRLLLHTSESTDRPRIAFAANRSFTFRFFIRRPHTVYMLYLCDHVHPRILISMSREPEGAIGAAAELPDDMLHRAEFLLIEYPLVAPSFQSWD